MTQISRLHRTNMLSSQAWYGLVALVLSATFLLAAGHCLPALAATDLDGWGAGSTTCSGDGCILDEERPNPVASPFKTYTDRGAVPFSISVDGEPLIGSSPPPTGPEEDEFVEPGIEGVDIQVKFDGLGVSPTLNVSTKPIQRSYEPGDVITFFASSNYPDWITLSEIRIFPRGENADGPDVKVIEVGKNGEAEWVMPDRKTEHFERFQRLRESGGLLGPGSSGDALDKLTEAQVNEIASAKGGFGEPENDDEDGDGVPDDFEDPNPDIGAGEYEYVLRVYDAYGNYDETAPLSITRSTRGFEARIHREPAEAPGYGDDRTGIRNITLSGGAVTIYGRNVPRGYKVRAFGGEMPVDREGAFVVQRILPAGEHDVDVAVKGGETDSLSFTRHVNIPSSDWFYVALAD
ncbi:MAG: hypothetical protein ACR2O4_04155, partial [Hyphomicrobiaceae bacterium]